MRTCDYCGEYAKVTKQYTPDGDKYDWFSFFGQQLPFIWICKKCHNAKYKRMEDEINKENMKQLELKKAAQKKWIKERDKILKNG